MITKKESIGEADFFVFGFIGAVFGFSSNLLLCAFITSAVALFMSIFYIIKKDYETPLFPALFVASLYVYIITPTEELFQIPVF